MYDPHSMLMEYAHYETGVEQMYFSQLVANLWRSLQGLFERRSE